MISVVIPTYNRARLIERAVKSVLMQDYGNIEVIVVDDCSTDNTEDVVKHISGNITYIKLEKNSGACVARNIGIDSANGKYIAFQDSDDSWNASKLSEQVAALEENNSDVVFCNHTIFRNGNQSKGTVFPQGCPEGFITYEKLLWQSIASTQCILGKTEIFRKIKFDDTMPRFQDWDFILRLAQSCRIYHLDRALVDVFVQDDSITRNPQKGVTALKKIKDKNEKAISADPDLKARWFELEALFRYRAGENTSAYMWKAFTSRPSIRRMAKAILITIGATNIAYKESAK